jgi:CubicO group peptidase (beta-lactamase class C family)
MRAAARNCSWTVISTALVAACAGTTARAPLSPSFAAADAAIEAAIADRRIPGAVLLVGRGDRVLYRKAYGRRALVPAEETMTVDTVFDLASLTKVIATATAVLILVDRGAVRLDAPVNQWIPEFGGGDKDRVTVQHLLTHVSGLRPDLDLREPWLGTVAALDLAARESLVSPPGEKFVYSDIGYVLLGDVVARASGMPFEKFVQKNVLQPLGMRDTAFTPPEAQRSRIAPTQLCTPYGWPCEGPDAAMLRGTVHDPTARRMGGVAGHAGLFGTADDLGRYARMILGRGTLDGRRTLSRERLQAMISPATPTGMTAVRGLGWDIDTAYSTVRGDVFPVGSVGHTGWTGTSIWIDPTSAVYVVLLTNRVHPDGRGDVRELRASVSTAVARALLPPH